MLYQALDLETTTSNKGHPFDQNNKLVAIGSHGVTDAFVLGVEYDDQPYGNTLARFKEWCETIDLFLFFNAKFDLTWLWKYGIDLTHKKIWDCQLFEYFASNQQWTFPDLDTACQKRGIPIAKDKTIEEYWKSGINTTEIPWEIIERRVSVDAQITCLLYQAQLQEFNTWSQARQNLFRLHCADLLVLHEIERNGVYYDEEASKEEAHQTSARLLNLEQELGRYTPPGVSINLNSPQQVSALLYGGVLTQIQKVPDGVFKTGQKAGQPKFKNQPLEITFTRHIEPLNGSKLAEGECWSSDAKVLGTLLNSRLTSVGRKLIKLLLQYSKEQRSLSSYTQGLPNLRKKLNWPENMLYGRINQCSVVTGRTSSSEPNLQNFDNQLKHLFRSRYGNMG